MRTISNIHRDVQRITTYQSAGRVNKYVVANGITLRVQALQNAQRASMRITRNSLVGFMCVVDV
jgi:hypothetical protein